MRPRTNLLSCCAGVAGSCTGPPSADEPLARPCRPRLPPALAARPADHQLSEFLPTLHNTLCNYLGRCTADNTSGLAVFTATPPVEAQQQRQQLNGSWAPLPWRPWLEEAVACFAGRTLMWVGDKAIDGTLFLVRRAMVGVGDECRARAYCRGDAR